MSAQPEGALRIMVAPMVLGQDRSLFEDLKARARLTLIRVRQFDSGNMLLACRSATLTC